MRIAESFAKMRLAEYCTARDIDRSIAVAIESFVGSQKVSCKKALSRAFAKYVLPNHFSPVLCEAKLTIVVQIHARETQTSESKEGTSARSSLQGGYCGSMKLIDASMRPFAGVICCLISPTDFRYCPLFF